MNFFGLGDDCCSFGVLGLLIAALFESSLGEKTLSLDPLISKRFPEEVEPVSLLELLCFSVEEEELVCGECFDPAERHRGELRLEFDIAIFVGFFDAFLMAV